MCRADFFAPFIVILLFASPSYLSSSLCDCSSFIFYFIYCYSNYVTQHDKSLGLTQSVEVNDLVFVTHAVFMTSITIYQCLKYKLEAHKLNKWHLYLVCAYWLLLAYNLGLLAGGILPFVNRSVHYQYSVVEFLGYVKVSISFVKYCPQAYMNFARKSTVGFAVGGVLLDLTGGLTALGQQSLDAYREGNTSQFTSNAAKLLLSLESIAFDLLFLFQHFVLYRAENKRLQALLDAQGHGLSREEQEALEAETQAKAKAHAAALLGAVVGTESAGAIVRRLSGADEHEHHALYNSVDNHSGAVSNYHRGGGGGGGGHGGNQSPGHAVVLDDDGAVAVDMRVVNNGNNANGNGRRPSDSHRTHLLQQSHRNDGSSGSSSDSVF
jgi:hypothetical protein